MSSKWYLEQLQTPEWAAKRREVWQRDQYTCQNCGRQKCKVCAHHIRYPKGKKPWECPLGDLVTWCMQCHEEFHQDTEVRVRSISGHQRIQQLELAGYLPVPWEEALEAELENILIMIALEERDEQVALLEAEGAIWNEEGQFYAHDGKVYDAIAHLEWTPELVFRRLVLLDAVLRIRQVFCIRGSDEFSLNCRTFRCTGRR